jgi:hypothetical protein
MCVWQEALSRWWVFQAWEVLLIIEWLEMWNRIDGVGVCDDRSETLGGQRRAVMGNTHCAYVGEVLCVEFGFQELSWNRPRTVGKGFQVDAVALIW